MPVKNNLIKYYAEIPNSKNYLLSNYGEVYKKSTWKQITVIDGYIRITIGGRQTTLSVVKLINTLFPEKLRGNLTERSLITTEREIIVHTTTAKRQRRDKTKISAERSNNYPQYDTHNLPEYVMWNGERVKSSLLTLRVREKVAAKLNNK